MKKATREWVKKAEQDWVLAEQGIQSQVPVHDGTCFHCQQSAEKYLKAGAHGVYVEGPRNEDELKKVGKAFKGEHLATSVLENGGKTPWLPPDELGDMGYTMLLYPTTILFRLTYARRCK